MKLSLKKFVRWLFSSKADDVEEVNEEAVALEAEENARKAFEEFKVPVYVSRSLPEHSLAPIGSSEPHKTENPSTETESEIIERLREVDRLKSEFIANMSHELRTPLNSIIGFSRVMLKGIDGPLNEMQEQDLNTIYAAGQHLLALVNDILDVARIDSGRMQLHRESLNLSDIMTEGLKAWKPLIKDKPLTISVVKDSEVPAVYADHYRLRQVLFNLVSNAIKFTEHGEVVVSYGKQSEYKVYIKVQDTGVGIDKANLPFVFERFQQVDHSTSRYVTAIGLSLAIAQGFVRQHGGEIHVESELGVGSTFVVILPTPETQSTTENTTRH